MHFRLFGPNTDTEWTVEGRRIIPLFPRLKGRTSFTTFANSLSLTAAMANDKQPHYQRKKEGKYLIYLMQIHLNSKKKPFKYSQFYYTN